MILKEWTHAGMACALRHGVWGAPCGYVSTPATHPLRGRRDSVVNDAVCVHGGVTFNGKMKSDPQQRWWIGFDMAHAGDFDETDINKCIRTDEECIAETNYLAEQLAKMGGE